MSLGFGRGVWGWNLNPLLGKGGLHVLGWHCDACLGVPGQVQAYCGGHAMLSMIPTSWYRLVD